MIVFVMMAFLIVGAPTIALGVSLAEHVREWVTILGDQQVQVPEANPAVTEWPLIGPAVYDLWQRAHEDLMSAARMIQPQLLSGGRILPGAAG